MSERERERLSRARASDREREGEREKAREGQSERARARESEREGGREGGREGERASEAVELLAPTCCSVSLQTISTVVAREKPSLPGVLISARASDPHRPRPKPLRV